MFSQLCPLAETQLPPLLCQNEDGRLLHLDSRNINKGDVFIACQGEYSDGRQYIPAAIANGAAFVFWDDDGEFKWNPEWQVPNQGVRDLKHRAGILAAAVYGNMANQLKIWGVTGTNGKTSITQWLAQASDLLGDKCAIVGTVGNGFWRQLQASTHTTPDSVSVQTLLHQFKKRAAKNVAIEVSSHGLDQGRVNGVFFTSAIFTNLTRDHLDYHGSLEAYAQIKYRLFYWQNLQHAIINIDDDCGQALLTRLQKDQPHLKLYSYGFQPTADICIRQFESSSSGMTILLSTSWGEGEINSTLLGRFNAQNLAACLGLLCANGYPFDQVLKVLAKIQPASGRMDCIMKKDKPLVVVDYAHTPDALEKALATLQEIKAKDASLWCVFGCGGNRDKGKRPLMGAAAAAGSDKVVVTSDNPRLENPLDIIKDILPAIPNPEYVTEDRALAIRYAVAHASLNDIILIAGKGHETYQDVQGQKHHFSDFDVANESLMCR